jgi:hypothetical protein
MRRLDRHRLALQPDLFDRSLRHWNGVNCLRMFGEKRQGAHAARALAPRGGRGGGRSAE